jgi:hypothetical protein
MGDQQPHAGRVDAVFRGGPFDGEKIWINALTEVARDDRGTRYVYTPSGETDDEFPTLLKYVVARSEPA